VKLRSDLVVRLGGRATASLFDPRTGGVFALNATALEIVDLLAEGTESDELVERVVARFDVGEVAARIDVEQFVSELERLGLVDG
jgi:PqqD family protein of HPr-rel-A system